MKRITAVLLLGAVLTFPMVGHAQRTPPIVGPVEKRGVGPLVHQRFVAVTHIRDYMMQDHMIPESASVEGYQDWWYTRTLLFAINGTERVANVGVYVLGDRESRFSVFRQIDPGDESLLLPGTRYFGWDGTGHPDDGEPAPNVGETIVVVSSEPVIVSGALLRGFSSAKYDPEHDTAALNWHTQSWSSRTLDVRQFDCTVPEEFRKVAVFCRNFPAAERD